ncbi:DNA-binding protein [Ramlibacter sp. AN1133]|uniref:DNA-binding protein n=1 Tax=Ramlibacter sp. AN1133 TaxID=3133429 RepID=UPI0030BEEF92
MESTAATAPTSKVVTAEEAFTNFRANGITISEWARDNAFNPRLVYQVLKGGRKCLRGESHRIAVALGMKRDFN